MADIRINGQIQTARVAEVSQVQRAGQPNPVADKAVGINQGQKQKVKRASKIEKPKKTEKTDEKKRDIWA